ncbi:MAG: acyloxyacyl hydrolase [Proteobacteria bacterium]|nr:acyloxyacyl hydrolase [Pseudomonadota bacterium]
MRLALILTAALGLTLAAAPAQAGDLLVGAMAHDIHAIGAGGTEGGVDVALGWRSERVEALRWLWRPRVLGTVVANTAGDTNYAQAGLVWRFDVGKRLYFEPGAGVAVTDGIDSPVPHGGRKLDLGSRVLFSPQGAIGWRLNDRAAVEASYTHLSHAYLAGNRNPGLDDLGLRLVWKLGRD